MTKILPKGKLPPPTDIESYIRYDDVYVWYQLLDNRYDTDAQAILNRHYIRRIYATPDIPAPSDDAQLAQLKDRLSRQKIWFEQIRSEKLWYMLFVDGRLGNPHTEIMIIDERTREPKPLSSYSSLIQNIGAIKKTRLYVKPDDERRADALRASNRASRKMS